MSRQGLRTYELMAGLLVVSVECSLWCVSTQQTPAAYAAAAIPQENNGQALTPFKGWSTWNFVGRVPTAAKVVAQAQALVSSGLIRAGYNYVLLDDFYYLNPKTTVDSHGYWVTDTNFL